MKYKKNPKLSKNRNLQESNKAGKKKIFSHVKRSLYFHNNYLVFAKTKSHENEERFRAEQSWLIWAEKRKLSKSRAEKFPTLSVCLRRDLNSVVVAFFHFRYLKTSNEVRSFFFSKNVDQWFPTGVPPVVTFLGTPRGATKYLNNTKRVPWNSKSWKYWCRPI